MKCCHKQSALNWNLWTNKYYISHEWETIYGFLVHLFDHYQTNSPWSFYWSHLKHYDERGSWWKKRLPKSKIYYFQCLVHSHMTVFMWIYFYNCMWIQIAELDQVYSPFKCSQQTSLYTNNYDISDIIIFIKWLKSIKFFWINVVIYRVWEIKLGGIWCGCYKHKSYYIQW